MVANPALTGFTAPKILWLRNNEPRNFDKTRKVLTINTEEGPTYGLALLAAVGAGAF
jgi:hypothetical protein